ASNWGHATENGISQYALLQEDGAATRFDYCVGSMVYRGLPEGHYAIYVLGPQGNWFGCKRILVAGAQVEVTVDCQPGYRLRGQVVGSGDTRRYKVRATQKLWPSALQRLWGETKPNPDGTFVLWSGIASSALVCVTDEMGKSVGSGRIGADEVT